ncbi:EamA family transporter [Rathayibacter sp. CAU 1779]
MNTVFYLAIARLDLATVGTIEFLGVIAIAAYGARSGRNALALLVVIAGVAALSVHAFATDPLGLVLAFANAVGFAAYIVLGHRIAHQAAPDAGNRASALLAGVDRLGIAMLIAVVPTSIWGLAPALTAFAHPLWLAWGIGVGLCSSVIPYVTDQLAMAMLDRAAYALMMALLPASAAIIGAVVLDQVPTPLEGIGIALVIIGIVLHTDSTQTRSPSPAGTPQK